MASNEKFNWLWKLKQERSKKSHRSWGYFVLSLLQLSLQEHERHLTTTPLFPIYLPPSTAPFSPHEPYYLRPSQTHALILLFQLCVPSLLPYMSSQIYNTHTHPYDSGGSLFGQAYLFLTYTKDGLIHIINHEGLANPVKQKTYFITRTSQESKKSPSLSGCYCKTQIIA